MREKVSRKDRVFDLLWDRRKLDDPWVVGHEICHPSVGGSEGLRRLRELRADGYEIVKRKRAKGAEWEYRLIEPDDRRLF